LLAESGATYSELRGLMVRGRAEIVDDIDVCLRTMLEVQPRYFGPADPSVQEVLRKQAAKRVVIRIHPERVASWDHTKLGGVY
jgi:nitroimidazol reductase NimA-like FMN-containing flavoprotein (pyridoxamine 5'-phosphate oxidase superfamily)